MDAAARFPVAFPADALAAEVGIALGHVAQVREIWPEVEGWINFPLFNQTGAADDLMLAMYPGEPRPTPQAATMPAAADVVRALQAAGFAVKQARVAVLAPGEVLRCHVDMYPADRLIVPLNDQDQDFRHVFGDDHLELSVCTSDPELTRGYFRTARQLHIPQIFHKFLYDTVSTQHGVIAC